MGAVVTLAEVPPAPGSVMAEKMGGPVTSDPDTAKTWNTRGAGLVKVHGNRVGGAGSRTIHIVNSRQQRERAAGKESGAGQQIPGVAQVVAQAADAHRQPVPGGMAGHEGHQGGGTEGVEGG